MSQTYQIDVPPFGPLEVRVLGGGLFDATSGYPCRFLFTVNGVDYQVAAYFHQVDGVVRWSEMLTRPLRLDRWDGPITAYGTASNSAYRKVREALLPAVQAFADAHPDAFIAGEIEALGFDRERIESSITRLEKEILSLYGERTEIDERLVELRAQLDEEAEHD